jgi:hypothetical protein
MTDERDPSLPVPAAETRPRVVTDPPVVARLVVEVRSDGSLTVARGALEDATTGQRTTIEARGETPWALALSLTRALVQLPTLAGRAARALLADGRKGRR